MALREDPILRRMTWHNHIAHWVPTTLPTTRIVIAIIVTAFTFAMVAIQETQTLVRLGGEIQRLEHDLDAVELERQSILADLALLNNLPKVQKIAHDKLGMRAPDERRFTAAQELPPGVSFDLPLWAAPTQRLNDPPWWEELVRGIGERITKLAE
jgi:cell division protein FtsL